VAGVGAEQPVAAGRAHEGRHLAGRGQARREKRCLLILQTGFCFGFFVAFIMNAILPLDREEPDETVHMHHYAEEEHAGEQMPAKAVLIA
jgi:hypothetical protein